MSVVIVDGGLVHYETFGRGKPVILVHGLGSWRYWMDAMEELSDSNRLYALDLWGFGDSDKSRSSYTVEDFEKLIVAFMDELGIFRASIIGHGLGGAVAFQVALKHPDLVDHLAIISTPVTGDAISNKAWKLLGRGVNRDFLFKQIPNDIVMAEAKRAAEQAIDESTQSLKNVNFMDDVARVNSPLLVVYGKGDDFINSSEAHKFERDISHIKPFIFEGSRHFPMLDESSKFHRLLRDFLNMDKDLTELEVKSEWRRRTTV